MELSYLAENNGNRLIVMSDIGYFFGFKGDNDEE